MIDRSVHPETLAGDGFAYAGDRAEARRKRAGAICERAERGLALYKERGDAIRRVDADLYLVPGAAGARYLVDLRAETCECPDHSNRPEFSCKHLIAAAIHRPKHERAPEGVEAARRHFAPEYRAEIRRLRALGVEAPEEHE
jgi:hypothetical protein